METKKKILSRTKKEQKVKIIKLPSVKLMDAKKFAGKLQWKGDPLKLQREWRDE